MGLREDHIPGTIESMPNPSRAPHGRTEKKCGVARWRRRFERRRRYRGLLPLQVPDTSLIDDTRRVAPMSPLIEPVLRDDCAPVEDGFVEDGLVDGGLVDEGLVDDGLVDEGYEDDDPIPLIELSSVPFTSTL